MNLSNFQRTSLLIQSAICLAFCLVFDVNSIQGWNFVLADEHGQAPRLFSCFAKQIPEVKPHQVLVQKHLYVAAVDTETRQPAWVVYRVQRSDWDTDNVLDRNFSTPDELRSICLEQSDYENSGFDLGHLYGLQFVSANRYASEVNQLCVVAAQRPNLNRGPWLKAENRIKSLSHTETVDVIAGQMWTDAMPSLPKADEPHRIASHCWIIFGGKTEEAYLFPQSVELMDDLEKFRVDPVSLRKQISEVWWGMQ